MRGVCTLLVNGTWLTSATGQPFEVFVIFLFLFEGDPKIGVAGVATLLNAVLKVKCPGSLFIEFGVDDVDFSHDFFDMEAEITDLISW